MESKQDEIRIRIATPQDAADLLDIYTPYVTDTAVTFETHVPTVGEFEERIRSIQAMYPYLVAECGSEMVGYAYASRYRARRGYDWDVETSIYLRREHRRLGAGRKLYTKLEECCRAQGVVNMLACVSYSEEETEHLSHDSIRFHERLGYQRVGRLDRIGLKFNRWYDIVWMQKSIADRTENQAPLLPFTPDMLG
ncbi:GNAT family N-acetyltransferase [Curtanaerobium respiraculi]|uniref:GNAT family N-acetyltransferase n=1 Tax=Curtanaerobium respiraculi TaxID=2949669 RepID=UPI0024B3B692|nr:GNAT family N-acetyltransferase [Curtanaerobium respiraculi]